MTNPQPMNDVTRVRIPAPLGAALKMTAEQRGTTVSDVIRLAVAREIAGAAQLPTKAQPAQ
mgnify:FL=1